MKLRARNSQGFTLVEVVVSLMVAGMVIGTIMVFMMGSLTAFSTATTRGYLLDQAQLGLDIVNTDIRLSASADLHNRWQDANAPGAPGDLLSWTGNSSTLILATAAENNAGDILFADAAQYISHKNNTIYYVKSGILYKRVLAAPVTGNKAKTTCPANKATAACSADRKILENVNSFSVKYLDGENNEVVPENARSVEVSASLRQRKYGKDVTVSYTTRTVFRND